MTQQSRPTEGISGLDQLNSTYPVDTVLGDWKNYFENATGMSVISFFRNSALKSSKAEMIMGQLVVNAAYSGTWEKVAFGNEVKPGTYEEVEAQFIPGLREAIRLGWVELIVEDGKAYLAPAEGLILDIQARIEKYSKPAAEVKEEQPLRSEVEVVSTMSTDAQLPTRQEEVAAAPTKRGIRMPNWLKRLLE